MIEPTLSSAIDLKLLQHVLTVSRRMGETRNLTALLEYAMQEAVKLVGALCGYIILRQPDGTLYVAVRADVDPHNPTVESYSTSILSLVMDTGEPYLKGNATDDEAMRGAASVHANQLRSVMCVPLTARGNRIGAIYVENRSIKDRFQPDALPPFELFANQAAIAIENAMLNDDLERRVAERTQELEIAKAHIEAQWQETVAANHLRTVFTSNIAHDLRSPLSIVSGSLSLVLDGGLGEINPDQAEWLDKANNAVNQAVRLTNDLFDLGKLELGGMRLQPERVDAGAYLTTVHRVATALTWPETVKFLLDIPADLPHLCMDPGRIQQVIINLLSNAIRATTKGTVTLYARQQAVEATLVIGILDSGDGISRENIDKLFERFQVLGNKRGSTGLGLAISHDLVQMHGGKIWVESEVGRGADFKFSLPISFDCAESGGVFRD